tara:strand:- start:1175 stop:1804 length:630 start_codon:yes stop_codon:yes gene_type:complete
MINLIYIFVLISTLFNQDRGWTHPETGWEVISGTHMAIYMLSNVFINNEEAEENHTDAIGVFFEGQCIGWDYYQNGLTIIPTIGDDGQNPNFPVDGDLISFYIYDDSENSILHLQSLEELPVWNVDTWQNISNLYGCEHNIPIDNSGACPGICDIDPNLDQNIDILDILYLVDIILYCNNCEATCGDINSDDQISLEDIIIILEIILAD